MGRRRRLKFCGKRLASFAVFVILVLLAGKLSSRSNEELSDSSPGAEVVSDSGTSVASRRLLAHHTHLLNCTPPSILEFPDDPFSQYQRQHGAVIVNFLVAFYMFWAVAVVCDDFFVPCLEIICDRLGLQTDVAGATIMALGSSAPELFASIIGVFITKGDIGVGTILGSAVFNVLFVIGVCGVFAGTVLYLAWWPFIRDSLFYLFSLIGLMLVLMDNVVIWSEATAMVCFYSVYLLIMFLNPRIEAWLYKITKTESPKFKSKLHQEKNGNNGGYNPLATEDKEEEADKAKENEADKDSDEKQNRGIDITSEKEQKEAGEEKKDETTKGEGTDITSERKQKEAGEEKKEETTKEPSRPFDCRTHLEHHHEYERNIPHEVPDLTLGTPFSPPEGTWSRICWALGLPINVAYYFTIPDVKKEECQKFVVISFIVCIVWIGFTSYILVWMVTIIGYTFMIPDTIMGLSLVAFGSSVPDCLSSLFVAQKGDGDMAVSHTVGSNVFDILICLGIPWLIKTTMFGYDSTVVIDSHGLFISCFFIMGSLAVALIIIYFYDFVLNKKVGCIYLVFYFIFMGISIGVEFDSFSRFNEPMCKVNN